MTEIRALLILIVAGLLFLASSLLGLIAIGANNDVLALDFVAVLALQSYGISSIVMHYGERSRRKQ